MKQPSNKGLLFKKNHNSSVSKVTQVCLFSPFFFQKSSLQAAFGGSLIDPGVKTSRLFLIFSFPLSLKDIRSASDALCTAKLHWHSESLWSEGKKSVAESEKKRCVAIGNTGSLNKSKNRQDLMGQCIF